jgi:uncharacterized protein (DUF58 family)
MVTPPTPHSPTAVQELLPPELLARLDALDVVSRKILAGKMRGERRSKRRGQSVEFADFRNYTTGDDLRFIDWNIYARLDRLFLKLFLEEEDLSVYVIVDVSASMAFGKPEKAMHARRIAAALSYISLVHHNRVSIYAMGDGRLMESGPMRGRPRVPRMLDFLAKLQTAGPADLTAMVRRFTVTARLRGVVILISDFLDKSPVQESLKHLVSGRYDLYAIQLLSPQELEPTLTGDLKLTDSEDNSFAEVSINQPLLKQYKQTLSAHCLNIKDYITKRGGTYLFSSTEVPFDTIVLSYLRRRGLLA